MKKSQRIELMLEFLVFGLVIGVTEDLLVAYIVTGEGITWGIFGIVVLIAIPFAIIGELIADNINFTELIEKYVLRREIK